MIRILLVDDHAQFRQALAFMLGREPDLTVVRQAGSLAEARAQLDVVDVAIVDLGLPDGDGADLIGDLLAAHPRVAILMLTGSRSPNDRARAVAMGAADVMHKSATIDEVIGAVRRLGAEGSS